MLMSFRKFMLMQLINILIFNAQIQFYNICKAIIHCKIFSQEFFPREQPQKHYPECFCILLYLLVDFSWLLQVIRCAGSTHQYTFENVNTETCYLKVQLPLSKTEHMLLLWICAYISVQNTKSGIYFSVGLSYFSHDNRSQERPCLILAGSMGRLF